LIWRRRMPVGIAGVAGAGSIDDVVVVAVAVAEAATVVAVVGSGHSYCNSMLLRHMDELSEVDSWSDGGC
jgi:hypothetical protein